MAGMNEGLGVELTKTRIAIKTKIERLEESLDLLTAVREERPDLWAQIREFQLSRKRLKKSDPTRRSTSEENTALLDS
jgi:hypothetical protein